MNLYNKDIRLDDEEENPELPEMPENPMEKMMSGWRFDKKFIEQRKVFLWGAVDDKSSKDITDISGMFFKLQGKDMYIDNC